MTERKQGKQQDIPLQTFHVDHLGPMMASTKMYKYMFFVMDAFTKFTWVFPTKTTTTKEVLSKLSIIQCTFGNPRRIISDRGSAFTSNDFQKYCAQEGINGCILPILTKLSIHDPAEWYQHVPALQQALNSTYQRSIAMTPCKLFFGVEITKKDDLRLNELIEEEFIKHFLNDRQEDREKAKAQIGRVQQENAVDFNKKRKVPIPFSLNALVAVKRTQFVNGNKFAAKFLGPYRVTKLLPNGRYEVQKEGRREGPKRTTSAAEYMKPWTSPFEGEWTAEWPSL